MVIRKIFTLAALSAVAVYAQYNCINPDANGFVPDYSGAELYTNGTFKYGRFEARMYMAATSGSVSSMFLYYNNSHLGKGEPWEEVDIEILGKNPGSFQSNIISNTAENKRTSEKHHLLNPASNVGYHTYSMIWTPEYVSWEIDGAEVRRDEVSGGQVGTLVHEESLRFNLWVSKDRGWVGTVNAGALPQHQFINWIKVYSYDPQTSQFTLNWKDGFDSFNSSRWSKGDWQMECSSHKPNNVNVQNGYLILSLTSKDALGFSGNVPQDPNPELYNQDYAGPSSSQSSNQGYSSNASNPVYGSSASQSENTEALLAASARSFSLNMQKDGFVINGATMNGASWVVYDLNGMVLLNGAMPENASSQFVSTRSLPRGAYLLKVGRNGYSQSFRFVKP